MNEGSREGCKTVFILPQLDFICGYCGARCVADIIQKQVSHMLPMCAAFAEQEPEDFLENSRLENAKKGLNIMGSPLEN